VALRYDGLGQLVAKTSGGVTTQYLVDDLSPTGYPQVVEELVNGAVTRTYSYGYERISESQTLSHAWTPSFYIYDGRGTVRMLASLAATVTDTYEYDAFGNLLAKTGATPNVYLYRGEQYDPDLSLYYLRARYYNQVTGRFLNVDSLAGQGQRRYEYAGANPVDGMDPSGKFVLEAYRPLGAGLLIKFPWFSFSPSIPPWCGGAGSGPMGSLLPPCKPCPEKPGIPAYRNSYLCRYYQPMVAKISEGAYGVAPALPLGLGIESHFADPNWPNNLYNKTGDAFGMSNGSTAHPEHANGPVDDINKLFSEPKANGCDKLPSYGERMRGTGSNIDLFLQRLEMEDAKGNPLTGPPNKNGNRQNLGCMYNGDHEVTWRSLVRAGIGQMQHDIPIFLSSQ